MSDKTIAVWFSCGAASAVAAYKTIEKYANDFNIRVLNNPIAEEPDDNRRFLADVKEWIGQEIETVINPAFPDCSAVEVWEQRQYMSGVAGAPCTNILKKSARRIWEQNNKVDFHVLGFTVEEKKRSDNFMMAERGNVIPVLIDAGLTKQDCMDIIVSAGIKPPVSYELGYPNANCIGCVKATSPTYWNHVRKVHPEVFEARARQSRRIGAKLVRYKGERIYLDELPENAKGRSMKTMIIDCGIFCEEKEF